MTDSNLNTTETPPDEKTNKHANPCTNVQQTMRKIDSPPSSHTTNPDSAKKHRQIPVDLVEEESMESFPASDPPSHFRSNSNRPEPTRPGQSDT